MLLYQIAFHLAGYDPLIARRAAAALGIELRQRVGKPLRTGARGHGKLMIDETYREDIAHDQLATFLKNPFLLKNAVLDHEKFQLAGFDDSTAVDALTMDHPLVAEAERILGAYLDLALARRWIRLKKNLEREVELGPESEQPARYASAPPPPLIEGFDADTEQLLARAVNQLLESSPKPEEREQRERSWKELVELRLGTTTMDDVVQAELVRVGIIDGTAFVRVRNRVFKRHERFREYLQKAINQLAQLGPPKGFAVDDAVQAKHACEKFLIRCQRKAA